MPKASPELLQRFEEHIDLVGDADRKLVFGCPSFLVGGNMFFGVHETGLFVKLPRDTDLPPFEPMPGRAMNGFFTLPDGDVSDWVRQSYEYAKSLPAKSPKKK